MLISTPTIIGPLPPIFLGKSVLGYVKKSRLLGMIVDDKLTWIPHMLELKKNFANKIDLLKRSRFLPKNVLLKFYFSVILPSVKYGIILWGSCTNSDLLYSIEKLHCRAAKIVYNLSKDTESNVAPDFSGWDTINLEYKFQIVSLFYRASKVSLPQSLINSIFIRRECSYSLRDQEAIATPRFNTRLLKDSLAYRGSVLWNYVNHHVKNVGSFALKNLSRLLRRNNHFTSFTFTSLSGSTARNRLTDYKYF